MPNQAAFIDMFNRLGLNLDPWQVEVIEARYRRLLLNCSRQAGKSTVAAILSLQEVILFGGTMVLLLSRSQRQSAELFRIVADACTRLQLPWVKRKTAFELELDNGSRIISLPCSADTIRGYSGVNLLVTGWSCC
jgi:phage terminase large subunit-like protein